MSEIKEEKTVTKEIVVGWECDSCHKHTTDTKERDEKWLSFSEGHSGWGNDSIESVQYYHVCSAKCFIEMLPKRIKDVDGHRGAEVADMPVAFCKELLELLRSNQ